jgi:hypothetical protein
VQVVHENYDAPNAPHGNDDDAASVGTTGVGSVVEADENDCEAHENTGMEAQVDDDSECTGVKAVDDSENPGAEAVDDGKNPGVEAQVKTQEWKPWRTAKQLDKATSGHLSWKWTRNMAKEVGSK